MKITPALLAAITSALSPRMRNRVDVLLATPVKPGPRLVFGSATVSIDQAELISSDDQIRCDCLLSPNCAHRAAAALSLVVADADEDLVPDQEAKTAEQLPADESPSVTQCLTAGQRATAEQVLTQLSQLLCTGVASMGAGGRAMLVAELHRLRLDHLVIADRALTSFMHQLDGPPGPRVAAFSSALLNLYQLTHLEAAADAGALLGRAREPYRVIGGLSLIPLFAEPVLTGSGFAGVQLNFQDDARRVWSLARIRPGGEQEVTERYRVGETWGGLSLSAEDLSRRQLLVANARARGDGRLGGGSQVRAAIQGDWAGWQQLPDGFEVVAGPISGGDRGGLEVAGRYLALSQAARVLRAGLATELFGAALGTQVYCLTGAGRLLGMADAAEPICLPKRLAGVWWPGLDLVERSWVGRLPAISLVADTCDADHWGTRSPEVRAITSRWCQRVLDAGQAGLNSPLLARDIRWLRAARAPFAAGLLNELRAATRLGSRDFSGSWLPNAQAFSLAWLRLAQY